MSRRHAFEAPALQYLYDLYVGDDPKMRQLYEEELANAQIARAIYDLRTGAGLTQAALARLVGTTPSVISRLEDADYRGHSVAMLRRIAEALNRRVEIRFVPVGRTAGGEKKAAKRATTRTGRSTGKGAAPRKSVKRG